MGGLRKYMPITFYSMLFAALALMGLPPFGGFWSKDLVLSATLSAGEYAVFLIGVITAILTAFYSLRMIGLVFYGSSKEESREVHEAPKSMWIPYLILAALSLIIGLVAPMLEHGLERIFSEYLLLSEISKVQEVGAVSFVVPTASILALIIGAIPAYLLYVKRAKDPGEITSRHASLEAIRKFLFRRYYLNAFYYRVIAYPSIRLGQLLFSGFERKVLDRFNYALSSAACGVSNAVRKVHTGVLNHYVIGMGVGALILLLIFLIGGA